MVAIADLENSDPTPAGTNTTPVQEESGKDEIWVALSDNIIY